MSHLERAIELCEGQTELAGRINQYLPDTVKPVKQANIWSWLNRSKRIPPEYAIPLQLAVGGEVTAAQVCPDTFRPDITELLVRANGAADLQSGTPPSNTPEPPSQEEAANG